MRAGILNLYVLLITTTPFTAHQIFPLKRNLSKVTLQKGRGKGGEGRENKIGNRHNEAQAKVSLFQRSSVRYCIYSVQNITFVKDYEHLGLEMKIWK